MSITLVDLNRQIGQAITRHLRAGKSNANILTELGVIQTALGSDVTTHDVTIQDPGIALREHPSHTRFTNDVLEEINIAKAGNLSHANILAALTTAITYATAPANTVAPVVSGTLTAGSTLTSTNGTWTGSPTFQYQWQRAGVAIPGAINSTYKIVTADHLLAIRCVVTGTNSGGTLSVNSNAVTAA